MPQAALQPPEFELLQGMAVASPEEAFAIPEAVRVELGIARHRPRRPAL
jgi:hypothetical protein